MKAFLIHKYGDKNVVRFEEIKEPSIGENDVLIKIHAASINPLDLKIRDGSLKMILPYKFPIVLGNDFSGVIVKVWK